MAELTDSTAFFLDRDGNPVPPGPNAVSGEVTQTYADGTQRRTYVDFGPMDDGTHGSLFGMRGDKEETLEDADWIKAGQWDVYDGWTSTPADTLEKLIRALGLPGADDQLLLTELCALMERPSWEAAPEGLRDEVYQWLRDHRALARG